MSSLEIVGLVAFILFVLGAIFLIITSTLISENESKVLKLLLKISIWIYGASGFTGITVSIIHALIHTVK